MSQKSHGHEGLVAEHAADTMVSRRAGYLDNQMDIIKHLLRPYVDEISNAPNE